MSRLECSECGREVSECSFCGDDFDIDSEIICIDGGEEHVCDVCLDDWLEEHHTWSNATIEKAGE